MPGPLDSFRPPPPLRGSDIPATLVADSASGHRSPHVTDHDHPLPLDENPTHRRSFSQVSDYAAPRSSRGHEANTLRPRPRPSKMSRTVVPAGPFLEARGGEGKKYIYSSRANKTRPRGVPRLGLHRLTHCNMSRSGNTVNFTDVASRRPWQRLGFTGP
jgi:hypothetical protein